MKRLLNTTIMILLVVGASGFPAFGVDVEHQLQESLVRIRSAKDSDTQAMELEGFRREMSQGGYRSFPHLLSLLSDQPLEGTKTSEWRSIVQMDPSQPERLFAGVDQLMASGNTRRLAGRIMAGIRTLLEEPLHVISGLFGAIRACTAVVFWLLAAFGVLGIAKYGRNLFHDVEHLLSARWDTPYLIHTISVLVFVLPVLVLIHPKYLPFYWAILAVAYMRKREFRMMLATLVLGMLLSAAAGYVGLVAKQTGSKSYLYHRSLQIPFSRVEGFQPDPQLEHFAVATNRLRRGAYTEAISQYKELDSSSPLYPFALNNIGVAYYMLNEFKLASDFFRAAIRRNPEHVKARYNLAAVLLHGYDLEESGAELEAAFQQQPEAVLTALTLQLRQPEPLILVPDIQSLYGDLFQLKYLKQKHWSELSGARELLFLLVILGLITGVRFFTVDWDLSAACARCGRPYRFLESHHNTMCKQCVSVFVKKENVDSGRRMSKVQHIRAFNRIRRTIEVVLGILVPGVWGMFVARKPVQGWLLFLCFWCSATLASRGLHVLHSWALTLPLWILCGILFFHNLLGILMELRQEA